MSTRSTLLGRHEQAVAKAEENAIQARSAKTAQDREYYQQMSRKWLDVAEHWR